MTPRALGQWAVLALFALEPTLVDGVLRGPRWTLVGGAVSVAVWGGLALWAKHPISRAAVAWVSSSVIAVQLAFFRGYHTFIDLDAARCAQRMWADVAPVVAANLPAAFALSLFVGALHFAGLSWVPTGHGRPGLRAALLGGALLPLLGTTPDASAARALSALVRAPEARASGNVHLPELPSSRPRLPHVLFVLTESVRATDYCSAPQAPCPAAPETAVALPDRVALRRLYSLGSYSAIAVNALLGGRVPTGARDTVAATPLVFDFARSLRADGTRLRVHYWSAHVDSLFERSDVRSATDSFVTLEQLVGRKVDSLEQVRDCQPDALLADLASQQLPGAEGPLFVLTHFSGTHAPYWVDPDHAPFQPSRHAASWAGLHELHNAYKNAIFTQDAQVARVVRAFLDRVGAEPWLVVLTSDHGEAFGEHKAIHHGQNTYPEQIHVPGFVAWGNGALDAEQARALASHAEHSLSHLDLLPTLLDAWGVWDAFALTAARARLEGRTLLRPFTRPRAPLPLTNCTELFPCPLENWGVLGERHALVSQVWDSGFRCVELEGGRDDLGFDVPECRELLGASRALWPSLPNGKPNRQAP